MGKAAGRAAVGKAAGRAAEGKAAGRAAEGKAAGRVAAWHAGLEPMCDEPETVVGHLQEN